ncbi:50S ribosomal protein L25 [Candidatus Daviesbacteria bacterium]|nr:50S ribosomal protein L25 [Candidatus Daviesbacteria bacterium]
MDRLSLQAEERTILGKKVKNLRKEGKLPAHVFGKGLETEHVSVDGKTFLKIFTEAGETGLIDLKIGEEKVRPVLVRGIQYDPVGGQPLHIDFYQVNLKEKVTVPVPIVLMGEEPESVHMGETVILQTLGEVQVEALPTDLVENIEVDISTLKQVDDAITVGQLKYDREKLNVLADQEEIIVKLAPAVTEEMKKLLEEQEAEAAAVVEEDKTEEGVEEDEKVEGEAASTEGSGEPREGVGEKKEIGETKTGGEAVAEGGEQKKE